MYRANMDWDGQKALADANKSKMFQKKHQKGSGGKSKRGNSGGGKGISGPSNGKSVAGNLNAIRLKMAGKGGKKGKGKFGKQSSTWNTEGFAA